MDAMAILATVAGVVGVISGIVIGWTGRARELKKEIKTDAAIDATNDASLRSDVGYIRKAVDDIRLDLKAQDKKVDELAERVTRIEESSKQAHKRIDRMEGKHA